MKNKWIFALSMILAVGTASAQNLYDAERLSSNELNGTARFVGMGGAMGALGGDISTIGTNPAGIGIIWIQYIQCKFKIYGNKHERG